MRRLLLAALPAALVLVAGCGGAGDYSDAAATLLQRDADALASAARSGDATAVRTAWARLQADVAAQQKTGGVTDERAQDVLAAGRVVATDVVGAALTAPSPRPTAAPVVTRAPAVQAPAPAPRKHKGKGKDHDD